MPTTDSLSLLRFFEAKLPISESAYLIDLRLGLMPYTRRAAVASVRIWGFLLAVPERYICLMVEINPIDLIKAVNLELEAI